MRAKFLFSALILLVTFASSISSAQVPQMINYQGKLTKAGTCALDTTIVMTFKIYADSTTSISLWSETQNSVKVEDGVFNVLLGSVTPIPNSVFSGSIRYLGMKVGADNEMTPRKPIVSCGYAYKAIKADSAGYAVINCSDCDSRFVNTAGPDSVTGNADAVFSATNTYTTGMPKAIFGLASPASGQTRGVWGQTNSSTDYAVGVLGLANAGSGKTMGLYGKTNSTTAAACGVYGTTSNGASYGVKGYTDSQADGTAGIYGDAQGGGINYGVYGKTISITGGSAGVYGLATAPNIASYGVYGESQSSSGYGVYGKAPAGGYGVYSDGDMKTTGQLTSTIATGTAPLSISSTTLNTNLNADMLDGLHSGAFPQMRYDGNLTAGNSVTLIIPHWTPWTLWLSSGQPTLYGLCFVQGFENDWNIGVTYVKYNGDGTSAAGGGEGAENSNTTLVSFGSGGVSYTVQCPNEAAGDHNIKLVAPAGGVELRYRLIY